MLTAQVTCVEDNEGCGEQCAGGDDGYCVDFHGGRSRRANFSVANIIRKDDWNKMIFSASINACVMFRVLACARVSVFWADTKTARQHEVGAEILPGVVLKSGGPDLAHYA